MGNKNVKNIDEEESETLNNKIEENLKLEESKKYGAFDQFFFKYDLNKDGLLNETEFREAVKSYIKAHPESADTLNDLLSHLEAPNQYVDLEEFRNIMTIFLYQEITLETIVMVFKIFDKSLNGYIAPAEMSHTFGKLGINMLEEEASNMIKEGDDHSDGLVDLEEFLKMLVSK